MKAKYDVVILGAGHNGLVAAAYLARAGLSVLLLEKNDYIGGATTSQKLFPDYDAWLSRYSYLVALFPEKIIRDLESGSGAATADGCILYAVCEARSARCLAPEQYLQRDKSTINHRIDRERCWSSTA